MRTVIVSSVLLQSAKQQPGVEISFQNIFSLVIAENILKNLSSTVMTGKLFWPLNNTRTSTDFEHVFVDCESHVSIVSLLHIKDYIYKPEYNAGHSLWRSVFLVLKNPPTQGMSGVIFRLVISDYILPSDHWIVVSWMTVVYFSGCPIVHDYWNSIRAIENLEK